MHLAFGNLFIYLNTAYQMHKSYHDFVCNNNNCNNNGN